MLPEEGTLYLQFRVQLETWLDDGEAAALAIAVHRNATLVTDDAAAQRKAETHGVRWLNTQGFLQEALPRQMRLDEA
jgi:predicted nucleic acid-binding protein